MNYYAEAIEIVFKNQRQDKVFALLIKIAQQNPGAICKAAKVKSTPAWHAEAKALVEAEKKILAIKLCRSATGMGLREAKAEVLRLFYPIP